MAELKFKVGQKVKVVSNNSGFVKAMTAMVGNTYRIQGVEAGRDNGLIYKLNGWWFIESDLQAVERTLDDLEVGDILVDGSDEVKVLGILESLIFLSNDNDFDSCDGCIWTAKTLKACGYELKQEEQPEETTELTLKEVADKFNIDVDKLRIKE